MPRSGNLFAELPQNLEREWIERLAASSGATVERIVSTGHRSPEGIWYDQERDEWVAVIQGRAVLEIEGRGRLEMGPGDWLLLPAHCRHRVVSTALDAPTVWIAVHLGEPPKSDER